MPLTSGSPDLPATTLPLPRWGRILYARYGGSAAGPAEMPERKCDHLNWPRFGLLSSRISARLVVISPDGWAGVSGIAAPPPDLIVTSSLSAWRSGMARSCVELFEQIRRNWRAAGSSIQELAVRHHVHRWTVRQALASAVPRRGRRTRRGPGRPIGPYAAIIDGWLLADRAVPRKQRHTARRIWQRLVGEHGASLVTFRPAHKSACRTNDARIDSTPISGIPVPKSP